MKALLVGIEVATVAAKVGLASARYGRATLQLGEAELCTKRSPGETIAAWGIWTAARTN